MQGDPMTSLAAPCKCCKRYKQIVDTVGMFTLFASSPHPLCPAIGLRGSSGEVDNIQRSPDWALFSFLLTIYFLHKFFYKMPAIPADGTWFDTIAKSFADVPIGAEDGISTTEFLEAAESLVTLFGACCSLA
jgi:hypothetical protein